MAQTICDGLFISGRDPQSLLGEELTGKGYELLAFFQPEIDHEAKRVSAYGDNESDVAQMMLFVQGDKASFATRIGPIRAAPPASSLASCARPSATSATISATRKRACSARSA
jgi:hypothetical protein